MTVKILNARQVESISPGNFRTQHLSGTGPYRIREINAPSKVVLELNPRYVGGESLYQRIEYHVVAYTKLTPLKLLADEIDICEMPPGNVSSYRKNPGWQEKFVLLQYKKFGYTCLVFNMKKPQLTRAVRQLFYNQLVHGDFSRRFIRRKGQVLKTPFIFLNDKVDTVPFPLHPRKKAITLRILTNAESRLRKRYVLFLKQRLEPLGIILEPIFLEYQTFLEYIGDSQFDIALTGYVLDIGYDLTDILGGGSYYNYAGFRSGEMDRLLKKGLAEFDVKKREAVYMAAHREWLRELPLLPLFNLYYYVGVSKSITVPRFPSRLVSAEGDFLGNITDWKCCGTGKAVVAEWY
ncbi:MAG: hypothetical protein GY765_11765 [bacterium]|nr:hypothetical protein [bacterium]